VALYKAVVALVRAYANIADELEAAGYSPADIERIKALQKQYLKLREIIRKAAARPGPQALRGRHAPPDRHLHRGLGAAQDFAFRQHRPARPDREDRHRRGHRQPVGRTEGQPEAIAETIENNVRSKIIKEHLNDPAFYAKMSALLDEIICLRKAKAIEYEEYLNRRSPSSRAADRSAVGRVFVQRMKTRWGSCNPATGSIRLNTDLARKPRECLEYILVHEMAHLIEPTHNARFVALMDVLLPAWQNLRKSLNDLPVRHEEWAY
jgi:predicted metal-dependent hydrolase